MQAKALWSVLALTAIALSGCSGDDDDGGDGHGAVTEADCAAQGLVLGEAEVMHEDGSHESEPACVEPGPPATVTITGLPATVAAYAATPFQWVLDHPGDGEAHTMRTEIRIATESAPVDETTQADDWGDELAGAKKEHQNFVSGTAYDATLSLDTPGIYYLRAFALVKSQNLWSDEVMVEVTAPAPTGTTHTITISGIGPLGGVDPADLTAALGDAVTFDNQDIDSYTISITGPEAFTGAPGDEFVLLIPGSYAFEATGGFGTSHSGTISVAAPAA